MASARRMIVYPSEGEEGYQWALPVVGHDQRIFHREVVSGHQCFRIPEQAPTFITDDVVTAAKGADLRGVRFVPV
jgi:hypothetical protein